MMLFFGIALIPLGVWILYRRYRVMSGATLHLADILHTEIVHRRGGSFSFQTVRFRYGKESVRKVVQHKYPKFAPFWVYYNSEYPNTIIRKEDKSAFFVGIGCVVFGILLLLYARTF